MATVVVKQQRLSTGCYLAQAVDHIKDVETEPPHWLLAGRVKHNVLHELLSGECSKAKGLGSVQASTYAIEQGVVKAVF